MNRHWMSTTGEACVPIWCENLPWLPVGCEFSWFSSDASDWELGFVRLPGPLSAFYMIQPLY